jgi:hypothetical protein
MKETKQDSAVVNAPFETKRRHALSAIAMMSILASNFPILAFAESFSEYVGACLSDLGIDSIPKFSCVSDQFRTPTNVPENGLSFSQSKDFVAHRAINNSVDAVYVCRWVGVNASTERAVGGEMIVHNRHSGATCFFEQQDTFENGAYPQVELNPISPSDDAPGKTWRTSTTCTQCHAAGAYIASPEIVGALAKYGLINDGHDVWNGFYHAGGPGNYATVQQLNAQIQNVIQPNCATACHVMGGTPEVPSKVDAGLLSGPVVMPSINHIIYEVNAQNQMPPNDPESEYRWINRDDPGYSGDHEDLGNIAREYPPLTCANPNYLEAHVVDSPEIITTNLPDKFNRFNLQDGLVCLSGEQSNGHRCRDYQTRYMCNGKFTAFRDLDDPTSSGDWELRTSVKSKYGLCDNPTWIQARFLDRGNWIYINGPADRLAQFDSNGLVCLNADQDNRKCSNYVVRFSCP